MGLGLAGLPRLFVAELAVVHDLADGRALAGGNLDEVKAKFAGHVHRLGGRDDPVLLAIGSNQPDRTQTDLFVDTGRVAVAAGGAGSIAVKRWDALSPSSLGKK